MAYVAYHARARRQASKLCTAMAVMLAFSLLDIDLKMSRMRRIGCQYSHAQRLRDLQTVAVHATAHKHGTSIKKAKFRTEVTGEIPTRDNWGEHDFRATFRFKKRDVDRLIAALQIPARVVTSKRYSCTAETALLLYMYRYVLLRRGPR